MPVDLLSNVKELLSRELKLCKNLRAMISRELEAIVLDGDMDELLRVLQKKDGVISELQLLTDSWRDVLTEAGVIKAREPGESLSPDALEGWGGRIMALFPDDSELPALLNDTREIADSIMKAEDEAQAELEKHAAGLRRQMSSRAHGRRVAASYAKMGGSMI